MDSNRITSIEKITALVKTFTNLNSYEALIETIKINIDNVAKNDSTGLYLYDEDEKKLKLFYAKGFSAQEKEEAENSAMDRHPGHVFRTAEILWINDQDLEKNPISIDSKKKSHTRSRIYVPVVSNNKTIGAFGIQSEKPYAYTEIDLALLKLFASLAADAYDSIKKNIVINRQNEENSKLSILAKNTTNHIIYADKHGKITWVNIHFENFTGYKLEDIIGKSPGSFLCGEATEREVTNELNIAIKEKKQCNVTITNYKKNGDLYNVSIQLTPTFNLKGEHDGFISIQQDISELVKNKIALEENLIKIIESKNAYNTLVNTSTELILSIDVSGKIGFVNDTWLSETKYNKEDVIGTNIFKYIHLDHHEHCISFINKINTEKIQKTDVSYSIVDKNGIKIELEGSLIATFENNELSKINSFLKNVTAINNLRKNEEIRVKDTEKHLQILAEISRVDFLKFQNIIDAFKFILESIANAIDSSRMVVWEYKNDALSPLNILNKTNLEQFSERKILEEDFPIFFKAVNEQLLINATDVHTNQSTQELSDSYYDKLGINSSLVIPIKNNGILWGVLCIEHIKKNTTWTDETIVFARSIGDFFPNIISSFQLIEKNLKLQGIMSSLNETVWGLSLPSYKLEYLSSSAIALYGYPLIDWYNNINLWSDVIYFEDKERVLKENEKLFFTGETFSEYRIITADNKLKWIYSNRKIIKDENGIPISMTGIAADITERKKVENELKNYKIAIDHSAIVSITDTKGNITYANDQFCKISQYSLEELIGSNHRIIKSHKHSTAFYKNIWETISKGEIWRGEIINKAKDNSEYHVETTIVPFMKNGKPKEYIAIRYESTEKAKFKNELEKQKLFYENILNDLPVDIAIFDKDHKYIYVNKIAIKNDTLREYIIGKDDFEYAAYRGIDSKGAIKRRAKFIESKESKMMVTWEDEMNLSNKQTITMLRKFYPVIEHENDFKFMIGYGIDITSIKENQLTVIKNEAKINLIMRSALDAILIINSKGIITFTNPAVFEVFGFSEQEMLNTRVTDNIMPTRHAAENDTGIPNYSQSDKSRILNALIELPAMRKDGSEILIELSNIPIQIEGESSFCLFIRDITKKKEAEIKISDLNKNLEEKVKQRTTQLEVALTELDSFSYSVSHDLKAPLRGIAGYSSALLEDYRNQLDEEGVHFINKISESTIFMNRLIDDLLELSKIGRYKISKTSVQLTELSKDIFYRILVNHSRNDVKLKIEDNLVLICDKNLFTILLTNLISNAIKFSSKKATPIVEIGSIADPAGAIFYIKDNGAGFDLKFAGALFGAFQRLHAKQEFEGTGIGLATAMRIINMHNGKIWADSKVDEGATFFFQL